MPKRKRTVDDDLKATVAPRRSKRLADHGQKTTGIEGIPPEIFDRILGEVALAGDERSVTKNLTSVERVGKGFQKRLRTSPAGEYGRSLNEAGKAAKRNYAMLPRGRFREGGPVAADKYVDMVGPGIHLLSPGEQSKVIDKVLGIVSAWRRADALNKMASYSDGLSDHNRSRLLDSAIDLIEQPPGPHTYHACKTIAKLHRYRTTPEQNVRIAAARNRDPLVAATIDSELDALRHTPSPLPEPRRNTGYVPMNERVRNAAKDVQAKVGEAEGARTKLINTMRSRDGRG